MSLQMFNRSPNTSKVNFLDEHVDNFITENAALRSKLQSKVEALTIMSKQLDKCSIEKDHYKLLSEQLKTRNPPTRKSGGDSETRFGDSNVRSNPTGAQLLADTRERNRTLSVEVNDDREQNIKNLQGGKIPVETLKHKLEEAQEDIKVLRKGSDPQKNLDKSFSASALNALSFEREELVRRLEFSNRKIDQMQTDLKSMLDEKEDLINERDAYKCKLHRLNHELTVAMTTNKTNITDKVKPGLLLDIDALVMENRYLQERLTQAQAEKELANHALTKYKSILESKQQKGLLKLGTNNTNAVVSHKQVKQLLECGTSRELPVTAATITDLRALCFGLLDALNDKSLALSHQKKANRILATRITDLERQLESGLHTDERISVFPSKVLLESYCSSDVDQFKIEMENYTHPDHDDTSDALKSEIIFEKIQTTQEGGTLVENQNFLDQKEDDYLPPELQKLVQEALNNLCIEEQK